MEADHRSLPVAVFLAILLIVLPAGADNVTTNVTTVAADVTTVAINETTVAPTQTTVPPTQTTVAPTQTTVPARTQATATPGVTTIVATPPPTVITPADRPIKPVTTGIVIVHSSPAGASILIDGVYSGTTPRTIEGVPAGNHILRLSLSGYNDYEGSIYVVPGQIAQGYGTLQPLDQGRQRLRHRPWLP